MLLPLLLSPKNKKKMMMVVVVIVMMGKRFSQLSCPPLDNPYLG